jgi:long-subunit acyl-CoA synthetase (AMP-forming)
MVAAQGTQQIITFEPGSRVISWLPAAHIAERMAHHYLPVIFAGTVTSCPNPREILSYLPQIHPTWFFAVPRIWEKLKAGLEAMLAGQPDEQRKPVEDALAASLERVRLIQSGQAVPEELEAKVAQADEQIFSGFRTMLGLDQVAGVNVGAAPTPVEVLEFFHALGIELAELWGMSETCGAGTCNRAGQVKIGTVGPPTPGCEIKIAEDGEVLIRSEFNMLGYRNQPDKTAETVDAEGWLHTGDIGELDEDGYLRLIDRKKEIIINAAGKNMSPANIEAAIKTASPLIGQAVCIGDARAYNTALIVLDSDFAPQWASSNGLGEKSLEELSCEEKAKEAVQQGIDEANRHLARVEQIKKFTIVPGDWLPGGEELTPTMKLKRRPIAQKYQEAIGDMYSG